MADTFYGINKGAGNDPSGGASGVALTNGAGTTGKSIELRLHTGDGLTRQDILNAIEVLEDYILRPDATLPSS